jgi:hypothetical protein
MHQTAENYTRETAQAKRTSTLTSTSRVAPRCGAPGHRIWSARPCLTAGRPVARAWTAGPGIPGPGVAGSAEAKP